MGIHLYSPFPPSPLSHSHHCMFPMAHYCSPANVLSIFPSHVINGGGERVGRPPKGEREGEIVNDRWEEIMEMPPLTPTALILSIKYSLLAYGVR